MKTGTPSAAWSVSHTNKPKPQRSTIQTVPGKGEGLQERIGRSLCPILGAGAFLEEVTAKLSGTDGACPRRHPQGLRQGQAHSRHSAVLFTNEIWVIQKKAGEESTQGRPPAYTKTSRKDGHHGTFASILKEQLAAARVGGVGQGPPRRMSAPLPGFGTYLSCNSWLSPGRPNQPGPQVMGGLLLRVGANSAAALTP